LYLIGLTGNIATGKSTVRRMLERLGARGIDADALAHQVMGPGTPVWQAVVEAFGREILRPEGRIDRRRLGRLVFAAPKALKRLEAIVHPAVIARVEELIAQATEPVVVIEAIKLIEAGMHEDLDALWVVTCRPEQQLARLLAQGRLSEAEARGRIAAQPPVEAKLALADVVIDNSGPVEETWARVKRAWEEIPEGRRRRCPSESSSSDILI
jgi:dephospho-CoA kinase